jgi:hypothetical protein
MGFMVISRKTRMFVGTPAISFTKLGRLAFNTTTSVKLKENKAEKVLLLWDKETKRIGVQLTTKEDDRAYKIHWSPRGDGCGFTASTFLKYVGLNISETRSLPAQWDDKQQMFIVDVPEEYFKKDALVTPMVRTKGNTAQSTKTSKIEAATSNKEFICEVCGKTCKLQLGLNSHMRSHATKATNI